MRFDAGVEGEREGSRACWDDRLYKWGGGVLEQSEHQRCCTFALKAGKQEASKTPVLLL